MSEQKSNFEEAKETLGNGLTGKALEEFERTTMLFEAFQADLEEVLDDMGDEAINTRMRLLEAQNKHARSLIIGYAGLAVAFGHKAGLVDEEGEPTEAMPQNMTEALIKLNDELTDYKEVFEEVMDQAFEDVGIDVQDASQPEEDKEGGEG